MEFDDFWTNFVNGIKKPILDLVASIIVYAITSIVKSLAGLGPNSFSMTILVSNFWILVIVYVIISITHDIVDGLRRGYNEPNLGIAQSIGAVVGTILFWNALMGGYAGIGGTKIDALSTSLIIVSTTIGGIVLQRYIHSQKKI